MPAMKVLRTDWLQIVGNYYNVTYKISISLSFRRIYNKVCKYYKRHPISDQFTDRHLHPKS